MLKWENEATQMPAVVHYNFEGNKKIVKVGFDVAEDIRFSDEPNVIKSLKRVVGRKFSDPEVRKFEQDNPKV